MKKNIIALVQQLSLLFALQQEEQVHECLKSFQDLVQANNPKVEGFDIIRIAQKIQQQLLQLQPTYFILQEKVHALICYNSIYQTELAFIKTLNNISFKDEQAQQQFNQEIMTSEPYLFVSDLVLAQNKLVLERKAEAKENIKDLNRTIKLLCSQLKGSINALEDYMSQVGVTFAAYRDLLDIMKNKMRTRIDEALAYESKHSYNEIISDGQAYIGVMESLREA